MSINQKISSTVMLVVFTLLISGCSVLGYIYNNIDWLILNRIDTAFDLTDEQYEQSEKNLQKVLHWHRQQSLPNVAKLLSNMQQQLNASFPTQLNTPTSTQRSTKAQPSNASQLTLDDLSVYEQQLGNELVRLIDELSIKFLPLLPSLSREQLDHFVDYLLEANDDEKEELTESLEYYQQQRQERITDSFEDFFGDLNDQQQKLIEKSVRQLHDTRYYRWLRRLERQKILIIYLSWQAQQLQHVEAWLAQLDEVSTVTSQQVSISPERKGHAETMAVAFQPLRQPQQVSPNESKQIIKQLIVSFSDSPNQAPTERASDLNSQASLADGLALGSALQTVVEFDAELIKVLSDQQYSIYIQQRHENRQIMSQLSIAFLQQASSEQIDFLNQEINDYRQLIQELMSA